MVDLTQIQQPQPQPPQNSDMFVYSGKHFSRDRSKSFGKDKSKLFKLGSRKSHSMVLLDDKSFIFSKSDIAQGRKALAKTKDSTDGSKGVKPYPSKSDFGLLSDDSSSTHSPQDTDSSGSVQPNISGDRTTFPIDM